jgi:hypothetical protein
VRDETIVDRLARERDEARAFAVELAQQISTDHPDEPSIYCPWEQHTASPPNSKEA